MKRLKEAFDPDQLLNPGKLFAETRKRIVFKDSSHGGEKDEGSEEAGSVKGEDSAPLKEQPMKLGGQGAA
ncbi:hypothetical protein D3C81_2201370 [compost metagenome]